MRSVHQHSLLLASVALCGVCASPPAVAQDEAEYALRTDASTVPTTKWLGSKYARGRLSVLVISGEYVAWEQHGRKLAEFKRALNLDMEFAVAAWFRAGKSRQVDDERIQQLLASRTWDVIMVWAMPMGHAESNPFDLLSLETQAQIAARAKSGDTGMLFVSREQPKELIPSRWTSMSGEDSRILDESLLELEDERAEVNGAEVLAGLAVLGRAPRAGLYRGMPDEEIEYKNEYYYIVNIGKGRGVNANHCSVGFVPADGLMGRQEAESVTPANRIDADYYIAELARGLLFASGREPEVEFVEAPAGVTDIPFSSNATWDGRWLLNVRGAKRDLTVSWRLRDLRGREHATGRKVFRRASGKVVCPFEVTGLEAGHYYLDVFVDSPRGRENFGYAAVRVAAAKEVKVELAQPAVEPGRPVKGVVTVTTAPGRHGARAAARLRVSLVDSEDRVLATSLGALPPDGRVPFSFDTDDLHLIYTRVEAEVLVGRRSAGWGYAEGALLHRGQDRFNVVLWGNATGPYERETYRSLRRTGATALLSPDGVTANLTYVPFIGHLKGTWRGKPYEGVGGTDLWKHIYRMAFDTTTLQRTLQPLPWNDPASWEEVLGLTDWAWEAGTKQPVYVYNLYDEHEYWAADTSPAGMRAYQAWLKEQYRGDLAELNVEWGSDYARWDDIVDTLGRADLPRQGDPWEQKAREVGNYARWHDRQTFAKVNFNNLVLDGFTRCAKRFDPHAKIGFEGAGGFSGSHHGIGDGMVFDDLLTSAGFWCPYDGLHLELIRSLSPPGFVYGFWIGYDKGADQLLAKSWRMVVNGAPSIWWWMLSGTGRFHGWLARDDRPYPAGQRLLDECIMPLRQGWGDLLMNLDQQHDGVAMYYSQAAAHAGVMLQKKEDYVFGSVVGPAVTWHQIIEACGFQWLYLTKERVLAGELEEQGIKLLILPHIQPLGADEVAALEKFASAGGTVVADLRPGVLSGHCRLVESGPADALFGIARTGGGTAVPVSVSSRLTIATSKVPLQLASTIADADVRPTTAKAAARASGAPVLLKRTVGAGRTVLLNCSMESDGRDPAADRKRRDFFRGLASALGLTPRLRLSAARAGAEPPLPEITTWQKGGVTVYAVFQGSGEASARLPAEAHVFDWRRGAVGKTTSVKLDPLGPARIQFLAAYPYDPGQPRVRASAARAEGGETVRFDLRMSGVPAGEDGVFSYHTRVINPRGEWVDVIPWSVQGVGSKATVRVRLAHNDLPGVWTLQIKETTTGRTAKATVTKVAPVE